LGVVRGEVRVRGGFRRTGIGRTGGVLVDG
jgi:hypothetical protein